MGSTSPKNGCAKTSCKSFKGLAEEFIAEDEDQFADIDLQPNLYFKRETLHAFMARDLICWGTHHHDHYVSPSNAENHEEHNGDNRRYKRQQCEIQIRRITFLRRLLKPVCCRIVASNHSDQNQTNLHSRQFNPASHDCHHDDDDDGESTYSSASSYSSNGTAICTTTHPPPQKTTMKDHQLFDA